VRDHTATRDAIDEPLLIELRDHLLPESPPEPSVALWVAFRDGLGDAAPLEAPALRRSARRPVAVGGLAAALFLGTVGVAGALPGPAQSAFDRTAGFVGIERQDAERGPAVDPVEVEAPVPTAADAEDRSDDGVADDAVVPDATDPVGPGVDDPGQVAGDAQDLRPAEPPPTAPSGPPVPTTTPAPGSPADPPAGPIDPERPGVPGESGPPPAGGRP
jgi:hypothetical protein